MWVAQRPLVVVGVAGDGWEAGEAVVGGNPEPVAEAVGLAPNPSSRVPGLCEMAGFELFLCTLS